ncbi:MAG: hypothetical protein IKQ18_02925 [Clostridia bacterium]|nr:hypothetical protein [Clostridia bacterium]
MLKFKEYQKNLQKLYDKYGEYEAKYNELADEAGCSSCASYSTGSYYEGRHRNCGECEKLKDVQAAARELDEISIEVDDYIENTYAPAVFEYYNKKKPTIVRVRTDEKYTWEDAFGSDFSKYDKALKHSLVGLVENTGRFRVK